MSILTKKSASFVAIASLATASAYAEVPEVVKTAIDTGFSDAKSVAALVIGGFASIFAIMLIKRFFAR